MKYTIYLIHPYTGTLPTIKYISCNQYVICGSGVYYHENGDVPINLDENPINLNGFGFIPMSNISIIKPNQS